MAISKVRARARSIKFLDLLLARYDETTMPSIDTLEAHGYCVTLDGVVLTVTAHEALCDAQGGVPV